MIRILVILIFSAICVSSMAQQHVVAFYNVENLFDTINCPATADEDMLPLSDRHWDAERYHAKLNLLSQIIADLDPHHYPTLVALAEVENRKVVEDLVASTSLTKANYSICHYDSPDERGIDVALIYRSDLLRIEGSKAISPTTDNPTRDILTVWGELDGEPVFIAVVHFPSRIGGIKFTEPERIACATRLREIADSVRHTSPERKIIIMGDMNDNPRNKSISKVLGAKHSTKNMSAYDLYTPFAHTKRGSSVYNNRWNQYDNIIVSGNLLLNDKQGLHLCPTKGQMLGAIFSREDMLDHHNHPKPTFKGVEYIGGASDHLPVYILLGK